MANKYSKALKHLKNKTIDEKLELLSEIPTNHTGGLYTDVPGVNEPPQTVPGDIDSPLNLEEDGQGQEGYTGNDTTGLFLADGTIKSVEPPGDTSYILGPMMSMWYAWANYTQIGYVRQSDRKMVNLGRITGEMSDWDGSSGFTGYGQMSVEQAAWYQSQSRQDYRAFYPGPPSNPADQYGRYIGSIISTSKSTTRVIPGYWNPGTNRSSDATDNFSLQYNKKIAQSDDVDRQIDNMLLKGLERGDYGTGPDIQRQINNLKRNLKNKTPGGSFLPLAGGRSTMNVAHYEPQGKVLTENRKRILRDIKKPVQVKEIPSKVKVSPKLRNKSVGVDMMKIPDTPAQYKPQTSIWGKADYAANVRASQEKKNEVLELVGAAEHHWTYLTEDRRKKQQEKVNEMMSAEYDKQMELLYEKHRIKEGKLNKAISAFRKPTDIAPEYPKEPPPQLDPQTGMHPKFGKNYKHDKLDPQSAEAMPPTGNPEIDANVKKATNQKEKARKLKVLLGKKT